MDIKKRGKAAVVNTVFVLLILISLVLILDTQPKITGMQVLDFNTAKLKLESALGSVGGLITQGSICVAINDPEQPVSFKAVKSGGSWSVTQEDALFCDGLDNEDFVVLFKRYDGFSRVMDDSTPRNLINSAIVRTYEILPSRYVEQGGNVVCDASFKVQYCDALNQMASADELIDADLVCCLDTLTRAQRNRLEEHMEEGAFRDEIGILQQPTSGFSMTSLFILILVLVVLGGGGAGYFLFAKKKPAAPSGPTESKKAPHIGVQAAGLAQQTGQVQQEQPEHGDQVVKLKQYAAQALQQGYAPQELLDHFLEQGWDDKTAREAVNEAVSLVNQGA
ncbi:hypothetical protein ACFL0V_03995 [Nanoarchaeota archaeon]